MDLAWDKERERLPVDIYGYRMRVGATVEDQRREAERFARLTGKRPTYYRCGGCESYHPGDYSGDCRNDLYRIDDPDALHGSDGWDEVPMLGTDTSGTEVGDTRYGEELDGQLFDINHEAEDVERIKAELGEDWPNATGFMKTPEDGVSPVQVWMTDDPMPWSSHASFIRLR